MSLEGVLFDFDGVIIHSEVHWRAVGFAFLRELVPHWDAQLQKGIHGMSFVDVHRHLTTSHGLSLGFQEFEHGYRDLAGEIYGTRAELVEGFAEFLEKLCSMDLLVGVVSNAPHSWISIVLKRFSFEDAFSAVVSSEDVRGSIKPAPDVYLEALRRFRRESSAFIAIEDSSKGIRSAQQAGIVCIALRNGYNEQADLSAADLEVSSFDKVSLSQLSSLLK